MTDLVLVLTTVPDAATGAAIARALVNSSLAACVNILPPMTSIYRWEGAVEAAEECQLVIKTLRSRLDAVEGAIRGCHPYQLPELLVLSVDDGGADYLRWVRDMAGGG